MEYAINLYKNNQDNTARYVLGNPLNKPLIALGLNPSEADEKTPDPTIRKVIGFAERNGFDSFIMLNLYPQRTPYPKKLHTNIVDELAEENMKQIDLILSNISNPVILACWGDTIGIRRYFKQCIKQIHDVAKDKNAQWLKIGDPTRSGHPRHPLYAAYHLGLTTFEVEQYITMGNFQQIEFNTIGKYGN
jgi:hypothetical protein